LRGTQLLKKSRKKNAKCKATKGASKVKKQRGGERQTKVSRVGGERENCKAGE